MILMREIEQREEVERDWMMSLHGVQRQTLRPSAPRRGAMSLHDFATREAVRGA